MYHLLIFDFSMMSYKSLKLFTFFGTRCIMIITDVNSVCSVPKNIGARMSVFSGLSGFFIVLYVNRICHKILKISMISN